MSTFSDMRSRIADDLNRSDLTTQINKAINRAIEHYENNRFWFNETTGTFVTVANQQAYSTSDGLPSDIAEIDVVKITFSSTDKPELTRRSYQWLQETDISAVTGRPSDYAWYKSNLYLYQIPNSIWTVTISYQKTYSALSGDSDTNDWTTDAEDLIEARARWWLYKRVIKDMEEAESAKLEELEALRALQAKTTKLISTGKIRATQF